MLSKRVSLLRPHFFAIDYVQLQNLEAKVLVRPEYLCLCHADQRYYQGQRRPEALRKKLPMALIHECAGRVLQDPTGQFQPGQRVVLIPNVPDPQRRGQYENYGEQVGFRSSGLDGFTQELLALEADRVVPAPDIAPEVAAITEFFSVAFHGIGKLARTMGREPQEVAVWGDGSLSYVLCLALRWLYPQLAIYLVGKKEIKTRLFTFVDQIYYSNDLPADLRFDWAFECCGGQGSYYAIQDIIRQIRPEGGVALMGVSEEQIAVNTRDILEKGLTFIGASRSGREDFLAAVEALAEPKLARRLGRIVKYEGPVRSVTDLHRIFEQDRNNPFKTAFKWEF